MTFLDFWGYVRDGGVIFLLFTILYGGYRQYWVFGWQYREVLAREQEWQRREQEWKQIAFRGTQSAAQAVELATAVKREGL